MDFPINTPSAVVKINENQKILGLLPSPAPGKLKKIKVNARFVVILLEQLPNTREKSQLGQGPVTVKSLIR
jgi:hypothetical protein